MRILHTFASPYWSGPAENIAWLALAQRALGHEVGVAVDTRRAEAPSEEPIAPRLRALDLLDDGGLLLSVKGGPLDLWRDSRRLRARGLDVVHTHFSHDHWVARWGRPPGALLVRSLHAPRSLRRLMPPADAWTLPWEGLSARLPKGPHAVLPALVDPAFTPAPRASGPLQVGMISTFKPSRRHALGIEAFRLLRRAEPEARLTLVGDGALEGALRAQAAQADLEGAVRFTGYLSGQAFIDALRGFDVVWILGLGNDWSARAAAQARACQVRVIAVDEGALGLWADVLVPPTSQEIVSATLSGVRSERALPSHEAIARRIDALYRQAGAGRASG